MWILDVWVVGRWVGCSWVMATWWMVDGWGRVSSVSFKTTGGIPAVYSFHFPHSGRGRKLPGPIRNSIKEAFR